MWLCLPGNISGATKSCFSPFGCFRFCLSRVLWWQAGRQGHGHSPPCMSRPLLSHAQEEQMLHHLAGVCWRGDWARAGRGRGFSQGFTPLPNQAIKQCFLLTVCGQRLSCPSATGSVCVPATLHPALSQPVPGQHTRLGSGGTRQPGGHLVENGNSHFHKTTAVGCFLPGTACQNKAQVTAERSRESAGTALLWQLRPGAFTRVFLTLLGGGCEAGPGHCCPQLQPGRNQAGWR